MAAPSQSPLLHDYDYVRQLGSGGHGDVFLYVHTPTQARVAIKVVDKSKISSWYNEIEIMQCLSGTDGVSDYITHYEDDGYYYIVMAHIEGIELFDYINEYQSSAQEIADIITMMLETIKKVHAKGIIHRDIKPENFIVYRHVVDGQILYNRLTLIDFSMSCFSNSKVSNKPCGSLAYLSPEIYAKTSRQSFASDMWAIGVSIFTLLAKRLPFLTSPIMNGHLTRYDEYYDKNVRSLRIMWSTIPSNVDMLWYKLIKKLLTGEATRLTAVQAVAYITKSKKLVKIKKRKRKIRSSNDSINSNDKLNVTDEDVDEPSVCKKQKRLIVSD